MDLRYGITYREHVLEVLKKFPYIIVYDTETTGLSPTNNHVVQFSGIKYEIERKEKTSFKEVARLNCYINPASPMSQGASEVTGLTDEYLSQFPDEREIFPQILDFLSQENCILCGYNVAFDDRMIHAMMGRYGYQLKTVNTEKNVSGLVDNAHVIERPVIDGFVMAKELIAKEDVANGSKKLANVCEFFGITPDGFHDSMVDVEATKDVVCKLIDMYQEDSSMEKEVVKIISISPWQGPKHTLNRVYVDILTSKGRKKLFYDNYYSQWKETKDCKNLLTSIDVNQLEKDVLQVVGFGDVNQLKSLDSRIVC